MASTPKLRDPTMKAYKLPHPLTRHSAVQRWTQLLTEARISPKCMAVPVLLLGFHGAVVFLGSQHFYRARPVARRSSLLLPNVSTPTTNLDRSPCPSENELQSERHFHLWDQELEHALRLSGEGPPKTETESWYAVTENIHVFSAFVATTTKHAIHIISIVRAPRKANGIRARHRRVYCIIRTSNGTARREARIRPLWTWYNKLRPWTKPNFRNAFILCPPPSDTGAVGEDVQVALSVGFMRQQTLRWLKVHHPSERSEEKCCAVCVRPIYGTSMSLWKIAEFIAHYRLVGARRFYFYDLDMPSSVKLLIARLQSAGVDLTLVPFKLIANPIHVHVSGQIPALHDCIFRSMSRTEYFIHVDFDELVVPTRHKKILAMIREEERKRNEYLGSIVLENRFFCAEYPINTMYSDHKHLPLQTRLFVYHNVDMKDDGFTKYIGRSRTICNAAVHTVAKHCAAYREVFVGSSVACLNHYRRCCDLQRERNVHKMIPVWDVRHLAAQDSFIQLSQRIERDELVRSLRKLIP